VRSPIAVVLSTAVVSSLDSTIARGFAEQIQMLQFEAEPDRAGPVKSLGPWERVDLALVALGLGVRQPLKLTVDSVSIALDSTGRVFVSVGCRTASGYVEIGQYQVRTRHSSSGWSFIPELSFQLAQQPSCTEVRALCVYDLSETELDTQSVDMASLFVDSLARGLDLRPPERVDLVVAPAADTMLRVLGILEWNSPISELTFAIGPMAIVRLRYGEFARHELTHATTLRLRMHPIIAEGLGSLFGGVRGDSLRGAACKQTARFRSLTVAALDSLLTGDPNADFSDVEAAVLGGLLVGALSTDTASTTFRDRLSSRIDSAVTARWLSHTLAILSACP